MQIKARGIVLRQLPYKDGSIIVHIYTRELGRRSFFVRTSKKSLRKPALFMPLTIIEFEADVKESRELHRIGDTNLYFFPSVFFSNPMMSGVGIFMAEVLYRTLQEEESNPLVFSQLESFIMKLDNRANSQNIHLLFLLELAELLGFGIFYPDSEPVYFDLEQGRYQAEKPKHANFLSKEETVGFLSCMRDNREPKMSNLQRRLLLDKLLVFYRFHVTTFGEIKSLEVLRQLYLS